MDKYILKGGAIANGDSTLTDVEKLALSRLLDSVAMQGPLKGTIVMISHAVGMKKDDGVVERLLKEFFMQTVEVEEDLMVTTDDKKTLPKRTSLVGISDEVMEVFHFWYKIMEKNGRNRMTPKRSRLIKARLKDGYTVAEIKQAIVNCSNSDFHMGINDASRKYDDLTIICHPDKFENFKDLIGQQTKHPGLSAKQQRSFDSINRFKPPQPKKFKNNDDPL